MSRSILILPRRFVRSACLGFFVKVLDFCMISLFLSFIVFISFYHLLFMFISLHIFIICLIISCILLAKYYECLNTIKVFINQILIKESQKFLFWQSVMDGYFDYFMIDLLSFAVDHADVLGLLNFLLLNFGLSFIRLTNSLDHQY